MPADTVQLVTGSGTTRTARGYQLSRWPWVFFGGSVDTRTVTTGTGALTYYGLDNSVSEVLRLGCYRDVVLDPQYADFDKFCDGVKHTERNINEYQCTLTVTDDVVDLYLLRRFMRQSAGNYQSVGAPTNIESLLIGDMVADFVPVLFEHHYDQAASSADEYLGIVAFEAQLSLGTFTGNYDEGYSAELTIAVRYSATYGGYLGLMRRDDVLIV